MRLTAFNPLIPRNDKDSGIPAAFFEIEIRNPTDAPITYTVAGTLANPQPRPNRHTVSHEEGVSFLRLGSDSPAPTDTGDGELTLATDAPDVTAQEYWYRGGWNDNLEVFWRDFTAPGPLRARTYPPDSTGQGDHGTLASRVTLPAGGAGRVRFLIAWHFPHCANTWNNGSNDRARDLGVGTVWRNYYATLWEDSRASAAYALAHWDRLWAETRRFRDALVASDLPPAARDAVSANISILKTPTVLRLEDGTFYGWEGCHPSAGCCEGSCTHVWNYAQALPFLFPALERTLRESDFRYNLLPTGGMVFRMPLPLGVTPPEKGAFRPCADGQFGGVLKTYRDWKICGDTDWLRRLWPAVKRSIEYAWHPGNLDHWDPEKTGVLWGRQHHTLDMELFGPNAWLTGFYLGALKAGAEMADALGEPETATEYREIFARGKAWTDRNLFNGEYYIQQVDLGDKHTVEQFDAPEYWSEEHGELKYQIGEGCGVDQVLAQWHANLYGLGEIFDPAQTRTALAAIFRHNFQTPMRDFYNPWRLFCLNDEGGLVIASWPEGRRQPRIPVPYAQETMNGFEYAAAILMIQSGMVDEGMTAVAAVRERYDGEKRNPWNEFECGSNYARSMASYALLNAFSGFEFDMTQGLVGFRPLRTRGGKFRCVWSLDCAWGEFRLTPGRAEIRVHDGALPLRRLRTTLAPVSVTLGRRAVPFEAEAGESRFTPEVVVRAGQTLRLVGETAMENAS